MSSTKIFLARLLRGSRRRIFASETVLCALALLPGSAFIFANLPPLWRDSDSLEQLAAHPGHVTLLQFPALYPFLSRLPLLLVSGWNGLVGGQPVHMDVHARVALNDGGIYLLIAAQHLALIFALALFVVTAASAWWRRVLLILFALATPILFLSAQVISSEALGVILTILLITIALHLFKNGESDGPALAVFGVCLYLNIMTRHVSAVYAALLPLGYLCALAMRFRSEPRRWWRKTYRAAIVGALAILCAHATTLVLCALFREPYRSIVSRTAIYRLDQIDGLPKDERAAFIRELQDKTSDPLTKEAIPRLLEVKGYWGRSLLELDRLIQTHHPPMSAKKRQILADAYLGEICGLYYRAAPPFLVADIRTAITAALTQATSADVTKAFLDVGVASLEFYRSNDRARPWTDHLASCSLGAEARINAFAERRLPGGLIRIPCGWLLLGSAVAATLLTICKRFSQMRLLAVYALFGTNLLLMIGTFAVAGYSERQLLPECVFAFTSIGIVLGGFGFKCEN
jgi:hypothetical protein